MEKPEKTLMILSVILYIACLIQPSFYTEASLPDSWGYGWEALLFGWLSLLSMSMWVWLGNPLLFLSWYYNTRKTYFDSLVFGLLALSASLTFMSEKEILIDEAGHRALITGYGWGYWLWLGAEVFAIISASSALINQHSHIQQNNTDGHER